MRNSLKLGAFGLTLLLPSIASAAGAAPLALADAVEGAIRGGIIGAAVGGVVGGIMHFSKKKQKKNFCAKCGYDLRGSTGDCPECGAAAPPKNPPTSR